VKRKRAEQPRAKQQTRADIHACPLWPCVPVDVPVDGRRTLPQVAVRGEERVAGEGVHSRELGRSVQGQVQGAHVVREGLRVLDDHVAPAPPGSPATKALGIESRIALCKVRFPSPA